MSNDLWAGNIAYHSQVSRYSGMESEVQRSTDALNTSGIVNIESPGVFRSLGGGLTSRGGPSMNGPMHIATVGPTAVPQMVALSAIVPCFNEETGLSELHARLSRACRAVVGDDYEIVLVDDGSTDRTWPTIRALAERDRHVVGVELSRNHGHQLALTAGLGVCRGDRVLIIDADLQDPPELVGDMMALMDREGADVVYGQRLSREGETWHKKVTASLFYRLLGKLTDLPIPWDTGDFRLMTRRALLVLQSMPEQHRFIRGMVSWIGFRQVPLRYDRARRFAGETKYPLRKMMRLAVDAITGFSTRPLRISLHLAALLGLVSGALVLYTFVSWLYFDAVAGWTSLMAVVLLLGSAQMLLLGIIGEYLGRLYTESKHRPLFIIAEVVRSRAKSHTLPNRSAIVEHSHAHADIAAIC